MFKENRKHEEPELFSEKNMMPDNLKKRYEKSWAKGFYDDVFCRIDETQFSVLFSEKVSRPNIPVNIYVSLEIMKELFGLSDEELFDRFYFDNLFMFAMGLGRMGEQTISERAFYYMRNRVASYEVQTGINLFESVFTNLRDDYIKRFCVSQKIKRIDSTLIGSNIRRLNRLKLFLEVLCHFLKSLDENTIQSLPDTIQKYGDIHPENYVFSLTSDAAKMKIQEIAEHLYTMKAAYADTSVSESEAYRALARLVNEQIKSTQDQGKVALKDSGELTSNCLQSPYDPDATYRKKGNQARQGYSVSVTETCDPDNDLQIITDVITEGNNVDDSTILAKSFERIIEGQTEEIIADGAYGSTAVQDKCEESGTQIVTTAIRGRKPDGDIVRCTDFEIRDNRIICCPNGKSPESQKYTNGTITAYFSHESCAGCPHKCFIRKNKKKPHVVTITKEKMQMDIQREKYKDSEYVKKCKLRPAVEGTMFQIKLHLRNGKSKYRGKIKVRCSSTLRSIAINFKRVHAYRLKKAALYCILRNIRMLWSQLDYNTV